MGLFLDDYEAISYIASIENWSKEKYEAKIKEIKDAEAKEYNRTSWGLILFGLFLAIVNIICIIAAPILEGPWFFGFFVAAPFIIFGILRLLDII